MPYILFAIAAFQILATTLLVANVGKPRQPTTGATAAIALLINAGIVTVVIVAGLMLLHR